MLEFLEDNFIDQLETEPMRENNIFDIIIVSQKHLINKVAVGEHLGFCDHKPVRADINATINLLESKNLVPNFTRGNFKI